MDDNNNSQKCHSKLVSNHRKLKKNIGKPPTLPGCFDFSYFTQRKHIHLSLFICFKDNIDVYEELFTA